MATINKKTAEDILKRGSLTGVNAANVTFKDFNEVVDSNNDLESRVADLEDGSITLTTLDMNGAADSIILDADGDTSISAPTDDQIDIELNNADDFTFTPNTFTALSGSEIKTNTINETTAANGVVVDGALIKDAAFDTNVAAAGVTLSGTTLAADGTDVDIDINITPKGAGDLVVSTSVALTDGSVSDLAIKIGADENNGIYGVSDTQLGFAVEGVLVGGANTTGLFTDNISEQTSTVGVTIDGLLIKDGAITTTGISTYSTATGITAFAGGGQASATALTKEFNDVTTVATNGDSVKLPAAAEGLRVTIKNSGAKDLDIFPASGDSIDGLGFDLAIRIINGSTVTFIAKDDTVWESNVDRTFTLVAASSNTGQLTLVASDSAGNFLTQITNASMAGARTITIPDAGTVNSDFVLSEGAQTVNGVKTFGSAPAFPQAFCTVDGISISPMVYTTVTVTAAALDAGGNVAVFTAGSGDQIKVEEVKLIGGGTNFGAGGDRNIILTDGTTTYTTIANADIEAAPATTLRWGDAKVPFATGTADTATVAGQNLRFTYAGGTTDHGGTGSIKFRVGFTKVA